MPSDAKAVSGSVIQRSFIPEGLGTVLSVATVPLEGILSRGAEANENGSLKRLTAEILGLPAQSILDQDQYEFIVRHLLDGSFIRRGNPFWEEYYYYYLKEASFRSMEISGTSLALHSLNLMVSPVSVPRTDLLWPFQVLNPHEREVRLAELDISIESFHAGLACFFSSVNPDARVSRFNEAVQKYDVPQGQSPTTKSDSLRQLMQSSKQLCLAPIMVAGTVGTNLLSQGHYVSALLSAGTGAAMTLVFIGTISVADYLVRYVAQKRSSPPPTADLSGTGSETTANRSETTAHKPGPPRTRQAGRRRARR
jgi:hypothetical protein